MTQEERTALQTWLETGYRPEQRRACIVLLYDEGFSTEAIAKEVGSSGRQVRRWLGVFRNGRMGIFPKRLEEGQQDVETRPERVIVSLATESASESGEIEPAEPAPVTVEELCARHNMPPNRRSLLGLAATLHNIGMGQDPARRHLAGRDLILEHPIIDLEGAEQDMLASAIAIHRKKVRHQREPALVRRHPS